MAIMDNSMDRNRDYRTQVHQVVKWRGGMNRPQHLHHLIPTIRSQSMQTGYYMMFLAPADVPCNDRVFRTKQRYLLPITMNGYTNLRKDLSREVLSLTKGLPRTFSWVKTMFQGAPPNLCVALQPSSLLVALNRLQIYNSLFNFAMVSGRQFLRFYPSTTTECFYRHMTIRAMKNIASDGTKDVTFSQEQISTYEWEGEVPVNVKKSAANSQRKTVVFLETERGSARENDFVKYNGPVLFEKNQTETTVFVQLKIDQEEEPAESFYLNVKGFRNTRIKRTTRDIELTQAEVIIAPDLQGIRITNFKFSINKSFLFKVK
jgi:hypothetical protein